MLRFNQVALAADFMLLLVVVCCEKWVSHKCWCDGLVWMLIPILSGLRMHNVKGLPQ